MVPAVCIVGLSGSGKTTLVEKVVSELTRRGYAVGTVKHDVHGFDIDREGKDSWRHRKAGSRCVVLSSPERLALIREVEEEWPIERIVATFLDDVDVAVVEGYKGAELPRIEVIRSGVSSEPASPVDENLIAVASDMKVECGRPVFDLDDYVSITDLIEEKVIRPGRSQTVTLVVDGRPVALKPFIDNLLREGILGMIRSLKGCEDPRSVELRIEKK